MTISSLDSVKETKSVKMETKEARMRKVFKQVADQSRVGRGKALEAGSRTIHLSHPASSVYVISFHGDGDTQTRSVSYLTRQDKTSSFSNLGEKVPSASATASAASSPFQQSLSRRIAETFPELSAVASKGSESPRSEAAMIPVYCQDLERVLKAESESPCSTPSPEQKFQDATLAKQQALEKRPKGRSCLGIERVREIERAQVAMEYDLAKVKVEKSDQDEDANQQK